MCKRIFKNQTKPSGDVPFYTIGTFGKNPSAFIDKRLFDEYVGKYLFPKKGDILVSASGTIGRLVVYDGEPAYFQDSNIIWLQHDEGLILNTFLKYVYSRINWIVESSTMPRLYNSNFLATRVDMPDTKEQQKIATFLAAVDKRVALLERKVQQLEAYKRGVMQRLFSQQLRFTRPDGSHFPAWQERRLGEMLSIPDKIKQNNVDASRILTVKLHLNGVAKSAKTETLKIGATNYYVRHAGQFIYGKQNLFNGAIGIIPNNLDGFVSSGDVPSLDINRDSLIDQFLLYFMSQRNFYRRLEAIASGSGSKRIHESQLFNVRISIPSLSEQQKIAKFLAALDEKITLTRQQLDKTKQFKKGLLQRMFV